MDAILEATRLETLEEVGSCSGSTMHVLEDTQDLKSDICMDVPQIIFSANLISSLNESCLNSQGLQVMRYIASISLNTSQV